jgi:hypothetical protein
MRKWTQEERQRQADLIRQWQPWKNSTGAKTLEGKAKASRNAFKGGFRQELIELRKLLRKQDNSLKEVAS